LGLNDTQTIKINKDMRLNLQRLAHFLIIITLFFYILWVGQALFIPLTFAVLMAFMMQPIAVFWQGIGINRVGAVSLSFVVVISGVFLLALLLSSQVVSIVQHLENINASFSTNNFADFYIWIEENFNISRNKSQTWLKGNITEMGSEMANYFGMILASSTSFLGNTILVLTYSFLILLYRSAFKNFLLSQFYKGKKDDALDVMQQIQKITQKYLYGLGLVILILGTLNTLGLWIIGLDFPYFWGFLAAFMTIIPYVGTFIGAILPITYSILTSGNAWTPLSILIMFLIVQQIEGNFVTPKVVGSSVKINPLAALIAMFMGWSLWGISGVIIALPAIAIFKVISDNITFLNPIGKLLSSNIHNYGDIFFEEYQGSEYSWLSFFSRKKN